jgi:hypothetical protein
MAHNPLNLVLRLILEIAGLVALGYWGWHRGQGFSRFVLAHYALSFDRIAWLSRK